MPGEDQFRVRYGLGADSFAKNNDMPHITFQQPQGVSVSELFNEVMELRKDIKSLTEALKPIPCLLITGTEAVAQFEKLLKGIR